MKASRHIVKYRNILGYGTGVVFVLIFTILGIHLLHPSKAATTASAPTSGTKVCGQSILNSPYNYSGASGTFTATNEPAGLPTFGSANTNFPSATSLVVIPAGNNTTAAGNGTYQANNTIFYFEPGTHTIQGIVYAGDDSIYIGGYNSGTGTILNGVNGATTNGDGGSPLEISAAGSVNANDTWEYLTIENYTSSEQSSVMGNENGGGPTNGNTYEYDTIGPNQYGYVSSSTAPATGEDNGGGYAIDMGSDTTVEYNCLVQNPQGAFNNGGYNDTISYNEISQNGLGEYPDDGGTNPKGCGCSGGGKLFGSINATITYNYIHDNYNAGVWLDFDNTGADISNNYIASNWGNGIMYEASYNANISDNTLVGNGWASDGVWPSGGAYQCYRDVSCTNGFGPDTGSAGGNPYAVIDLSDSGGNSNLSSIAIPNDVPVSGCSSSCSVTSRYSGQVLVQGNVLTNNFGGVKVYTDTNRYPDNIDYDSSCSVPLGSGADGQQSNSMMYYRQTKTLEIGGDAVISGATVTTASGTQTLCGDYSATQATETDASTTRSTQAPAVGMAVFDENSGDFLGTIASVSSANSFTLNRSPGNESGASLLMSAYGGCGPADYYESAPGVASGTPSADYWDNCIWGSHNVTVSGNTFTLNAGAVTGCTTANLCGFMMDEAFNAGVPTLVQYFDGYTNLIAKASGGLGNVWSDNAYTWSSGSGSPTNWQFWAGSQNNLVTQAAWQASPYGQDAGSSFSNGSSAPPPSTPNNVTVVANSPTSVTVTWTASTDSGGPGLGGYYILRNGTKVASVNASATSYTDTGVSGGTQYSYTVEAYDTASSPNVSAASTAANVTPPYPRPTTPTGLTTISDAYNSVAIAWTASTDSGGPGLGGYYVIRNGVNITPSGISATAYTDTTVSASTSYSYTVEAYDTASSPNVSSISSADSVTTPSAPVQATPPTAPTNVSATAVSSSQINVSWTAATSPYGVTGYIIYSGSGSQVATVTTTSYGVTGLAAATSYSYYIKAYNGAGDSVASSVVSASTSAQTVTTPPSITLNTAPVNGGDVHGNATPVDITTTDHAGSTVIGAQLLLNGAVAQSLTSAPYNFTLDSLTFHDGSYTLTTTAADTLGLVGSSSSRTIIINNGDLTNAGSVGVADLAIVASHWGQADPNYADGNITGQSTVNVSDLSVLASNWGWKAP